MLLYTLLLLIPFNIALNTKADIITYIPTDQLINEAGALHIVTEGQITVLTLTIIEGSIKYKPSLSSALLLLGTNL